MIAKEFHGIESFMLHLAEVDLAVKVMEHKALEKCAKLIEKDAKEQLGYYQGQVGPFAKWDDLKEATVKHHESLGVGDTPLMLTGELYASIEHEVHENEAFIGSKSDVAVYQEMGTSTIPPRPFLGPAAFKNKEKIEKIVGSAVVSAMLYGAEGAFVPLFD